MKKHNPKIPLVAVMLDDQREPLKQDSHAVLMAQAEAWLTEVHNLLSGCASKTDGDPIAFRLAAMEVRNAIGQLRSRADCLRQFSKPEKE